MGNQQTKERKIKCFNELNTRFGEAETNYFIPLHKCKTNLNATFLREFPKGCYNYFCEECYYAYYKNKDKPSIDYDDKEGKHPIQEDKIDLKYDDDEYTYSSKLPIPESEREMVTGPWPDEMRMEKPIWTEIVEGVDRV